MVSLPCFEVPLFLQEPWFTISLEVQAKKHFTAEELSMRRAEMARRRRNLSEKRNEEVKVN
jgi:Ino eighty subunit 2